MLRLESEKGELRLAGASQVGESRLWSGRAAGGVLTLLTNNIANELKSQVFIQLMITIMSILKKY